MRKTWFLLAFVSVTLAACIKNTISTNGNNNCTPVAPSTEQPQILSFIKLDTVPYSKDTSGVYYSVVTPGTGPSATVSSTIVFAYKATLLNGTVLGNVTDSIFLPLSTAIPGFTYMARYFKKDSHIKLIIPSSLAYGCQGITNNGTVIVPANAVVFYDLKIKGIQ